MGARVELAQRRWMSSTNRSIEFLETRHRSTVSVISWTRSSSGSTSRATGWPLAAQFHDEIDPGSTQFLQDRDAVCKSLVLCAEDDDEGLAFEHNAGRGRRHDPDGSSEPGGHQRTCKTIRDDGRRTPGCGTHDVDCVIVNVAVLIRSRYRDQTGLVISHIFVNEDQAHVRGSTRALDGDQATIVAAVGLHRRFVAPRSPRRVDLVQVDPAAPARPQSRR